VTGDILQLLRQMACHSGNVLHDARDILEDVMVYTLEDIIGIFLPGFDEKSIVDMTAAIRRDGKDFPFGDKIPEDVLKVHNTH
jgi:hypothetical protein